MKSISELEEEVLRIQTVLKDVEHYVKVFPKCQSLYRGRCSSSGGCQYESKHYNFVLLQTERVSSLSEYQLSTSGNDHRYLMTYDPDDRSFVWGDDDVYSIPEGIMTEEEIFQNSLVLEPELLQGMLFFQLCYKHELPVFSITTKTLKLLELLVQGLFIPKGGVDVRSTDKVGGIKRLYPRGYHELF